MNLPDTTLAAMAKDGSDDAFDQLVSRHRTPIYLLARSRVACRDAALDIAQETFVQAYLSIRVLRDPAAFGAWLRGIAMNLCRMHVRQTREVATEAGVLQRMVDGRTPPHSGALDAGVREALNALPPGARSAAILRFLEGLSLREIGEILGISLPAAKSRVREARIRLREEMIDMVRSAAKPARPGREFNQDLGARLALVRWYREFSELIDSGFSLVAAIDHLGRDGFPEPIREASVKLGEALQSGATLSDALRNLPALQAPQVFGMIRMGEIGGILEWGARFLADWLDIEESRHDLEVAFWCGALGSMIWARVPLLMAVETSHGVTSNERLGRVARDMAAAIEAGGSPSAALERAGDIVPDIVIVCASAGEAAGCFDWALRLAAAELNARTAAKLTGADVPLLIPEASAARTAVGAAGSLRRAASSAPPSDGVREAFVTAVGALLLEHPSPAVRAAAASLLARLGAVAKAGVCVRALEDGEERVRIAAVRALAALPADGAAEIIAERLTALDSATRRTAIEALASMGAHGAAPRIARCMAESDERVPGAAVRALESLDEIDILTATAIDLLGDERRGRRELAARVLESHPAPKAAEPLISVLNDESQAVRWTAARALACLGRKECVPALLEAIATPWSGVVRRHAEPLALVGGPSEAPAIRRAIEEERLPAEYVWIAERLEGRK